MTAEAGPSLGRFRLAGPLTGIAGLLAALAVYLGWELTHRGTYLYSTGIFPLDDADEWRYTACSRLVEHGYSLFDQVFSAQPPLLFGSLAGGMRLFGDSIAGARWVEIFFGAVALASVAWVAWMMSGPIAGGAAGLLLGLSPLFLVYSRAIEAEMPMAAMVALGLALAMASRKSRWRVLPVLAGLTLAAAILFKLFAIEALLPALWIVWQRGDRRHSVLATAGLLAGALLPVVLSFTLLSPAAQWDQVISMHQRAATASLPGLIPPLNIIGDFLGVDPGIALLASAGLVMLAVLEVRDDLIFLLLWAGGTLLMLLVFRPLFPHHAVILLPPVAVAAGTTVSAWLYQLRSRRWLAAIPLSVALAVYLALSPRLAHADRHVLVPGGPPAMTQQLARIIDSHSRPGDVVASDDLEAADVANRLVPAPLCDLSNVRLRSGYLTTPQTIAAVKRYNARLIVASPGGIFSQVPGFLPWARRHYSLVSSKQGATVLQK